MHRMNDQPGNLVTHFFVWMTAIAAALGLTTQDVIYILFSAIGVLISIASYVNGRFDARANKREDARRTDLLESYIEHAKQKGGDPAAIFMMYKAIQEAGKNDTRTKK